jgi:hypothetical protein
MEDPPVLLECGVLTPLSFEGIDARKKAALKRRTPKNRDVAFCRPESGI